jgi:peptidyl-prolyl cis-trans isomerase C
MTPAQNATPGRRALALALALLAAPLAAQEAGPDTVVATVNGTNVTLGDLQAVRRDLPGLPPGMPAEIIYDGIRQQLVNQLLLAQAAEAAGIASEDGVARSIEIQRQGLLAQYYLRRVVEERLTDAAVQAAYDARYGAAPAVREVRASHILVSEQAKAQDLRAQIEAGAEFAELAREHGTDGTRNTGGDLGYFTREVMVAPFADAAFAMEIGEVSQPVQTQFGWHLIKLTDSRDQPKPTLDAVRADLEEELGRQIVEAALSELNAAASVRIVENRPGAETLTAPAN